MESREHDEDPVSEGLALVEREHRASRFVKTQQQFSSDRADFLHHEDGNPFPVYGLGFWQRLLVIV